ncbi:MAG: penicillin-binding protein 2 [Pseudomonadota bacterium]
MRRAPIKDHERELRLFTSRVTLGLIFLVLMVLGLLARLAYLEIFSHEHYKTLSEQNRVRVLPEVAPRGLIYDREGRLLADNYPSFSLVIVPEQVDDLRATLQELSTLVNVTDADLDRFQKTLARSRRFNAIPLRHRLNEEEVASLALNRYRLQGVEVEARLLRSYPLGELAAHALGYVGRISEDDLKDIDEASYAGAEFIGKRGVEKSYEDLLRGVVGFKQVETNSRGRPLRVLDRTPPTPGKNLYLSIDADMQVAGRVALGEERGAVVAINTRTGQVLALVSAPEYDPNLFVTGIDAARYDALANSPDRPLFNRVLQGRYPPGSTIKPFMALAALELGLRTPHDDLNCIGYYTLGKEGRRYRDWKKHGHGRTDMTKAIVESCDVYFYTLARDMSIDQMHSFLSQFGLGSLTGIDIIGETAGLLPSTAWKRKAMNQPWYQGETVISSIGQGYTLTTPLQLAVATAALAGGRVRMYPQIVDHMEDPLTGTQTPFPRREAQRIPIKHQANWDAVLEAMHQVVSTPSGTAHRITQGLSYTIGGKTGTAQVFSLGQDEKYEEDKLDKRLLDHALFVAFAPVEAPEIAVAVIVENGGHGGSVAAPVARMVMDVYMSKRAQP